jgi:hypothetical protein
VEGLATSGTQKIVDATNEVAQGKNTVRCALHINIYRINL